MGGYSKEVALALKVIIGVVFAGWIMMWIMVPTLVYRKNWRLKIRADTGESTYFGSPGVPLLIFSFPIMFVSVVACIYLHLEQKRSKSTGCKIDLQKSARKKKQQFGSRPLVTKGPVGIVSSTELLFFLMFMALVIWCFLVYLRVSFSNITKASALKRGEQVWEVKMWHVGLRLGLVGQMCMGFLFFPITRTSSLLPLIGLTSDSGLRYHIWVGHLVMVLFTAHSIAYVVYWAATDQISEMLKWANAEVSNVAGELSIVFGLVLWATTFPSIRRKNFELFFYTHQLYVPFLLFYLLHVGIDHVFRILPGIYLFMLDRYLRFLQSRTCNRLLAARVLPSTVELTFAKSPGFDYTTMSTIFMNIPSISKLQWHPFTVSSSSSLEPQRLSVLIKVEGKWTQTLHQMLSSPNPSTDGLQVSLEGPYGPKSDDFFKYDSLVLISGGSGIAPFIAVIRELAHMSSVAAANLDAKFNIPAVHLICAFKSSADLTMLDLLLPLSGDYPSDILSNLNIHIDAFVTKEKIEDHPKKQPHRTIWFRHSISNLPIMPVLGPNSWLWLAAVISSSFVAFLLLIGIINRYYIYPIDKNTDDVFSHGGRSMLTLLAMCISIAGAAGAAVWWSKKRVELEARQVQSVHGITPESSPCGGIVGAEVESCSSEALVQATTVKYGTRPNLERILLERKDENVGVFVSGPSAMRRQVAAICVSGLVNNLHFESVSYTW